VPKQPVLAKATQAAKSKAKTEEDEFEALKGDMGW
jgi:hypothetical protein